MVCVCAGRVCDVVLIRLGVGAQHQLMGPMAGWLCCAVLEGTCLSLMICLTFNVYSLTSTVWFGWARHGNGVVCGLCGLAGLSNVWFCFWLRLRCSCVLCLEPNQWY